MLLFYGVNFSILCHKIPLAAGIERTEENIIKADFLRNLKGKTLFESRQEEAQRESLWLNPLSAENF